MHEPSIPLWPRSSEQVERFMQMLGKTIRHNIDCQTNTWKNSIRIVSLNYRNSIHPTTNETPAKLFFGRETNFGIPHYDNVKDPSFDKVNLHHQQYNAKAKENIDKKCKELHHNFKIGDQVFLQTGKKGSKFRLNYYNDVCTIIDISNTLITIKNNKANQCYKRHFSFVKPPIHRKIEINEEADTEIPVTTKQTVPFTIPKTILNWGGRCYIAECNLEFKGSIWNLLKKGTFGDVLPRNTLK